MIYLCFCLDSINFEYFTKHRQCNRSSVHVSIFSGQRFIDMESVWVDVIIVSKTVRGSKHLPIISSFPFYVPALEILPSFMLPFYLASLWLSHAFLLTAETHFSLQLASWPQWCLWQKSQYWNPWWQEQPISLPALRGETIQNTAFYLSVLQFFALKGLMIYKRRRHEF